MILKACLTLSDPARSCQVSAELELDNQVTPEVVSTRTSELLLGLQSGITNAVSGSTLKNVTPATNPPALAAAGANNKVIPANRETWQTAPVAPRRKQRPGDQPSPGQRKFVNDLLHPEISFEFLLRISQHGGISGIHSDVGQVVQTGGQ